jgi:DNA-binding transcriptional MerR regulator
MDICFVSGGIMRIGEIAQKVHVSRSLIRYYEKVGILPRAARDSFGYRCYEPCDLARIELITGARRLGCSFVEIKILLEMQTMQNAPPGNVLESLALREVEVGKEMDRLRQIQAELARLRRAALALAQPGEVRGE